jgi:hypothetical protein
MPDDRVRVRPWSDGETARREIADEVEGDVVCPVRHGQGAERAAGILAEIQQGPGTGEVDRVARREAADVRAGVTQRNGQVERPPLLE